MLDAPFRFRELVQELRLQIYPYALVFDYDNQLIQTSI
jgi:hypothetical protein